MDIIAQSRQEHAPKYSRSCSSQYLRLTIYIYSILLTLIGALVVTHAMLRRLTSWRCIIIIIIIIPATAYNVAYQ